MCPYILKDKRNDIDSGLPPETAGELNYKLTTVILEYLKNKGKSYATINDINGALVCCRDEFQRRVTADYENSKAKSNGDCYPQL